MKNLNDNMIDIMELSEQLLDLSDKVAKTTKELSDNLDLAIQELIKRGSVKWK